MKRAAKLAGLVWGVTALAFIATVIVMGLSLPDRVATHFNSAGAPNGWMNRDQHVAFTCLFGVGFSVFFIAIFSLFRFLPPSALNVPNADYWRVSHHYRRACLFLSASAFWMASASLVWTGWLNAQIVAANEFSPPVLNESSVLQLGLVFCAFTAAWVAVILWYFLRAGRAHEAEI